jgi:peptidoglycan/LPS O-acetylase OafA/YrhL
MDRKIALKQNNFDLVRLIAAIQVFFTHAIDHLDIQNPVINFLYYKILIFFPGVPIFFTVSGFLIYASYERNKDDLKKFYQNRILRIYPALIVCIFFTLLLLWLDSTTNIFNVNLLSWLIAQITFFQFYTPDILRFWGVGTPNGSLWTISVEIQFYLLIPLIYFLFRSKNKWIIIFSFVFIFSLLNNIIFNDRSHLFGKLYNLFIFKYLYYFLFGVLAYKCWDFLHHIFIKRFVFITVLYTLYFVFFGNILKYDISSYFITSPFTFIAHVLLSLWTLSLAYTGVGLSDRLLGGNDISYGVYIYHMPVVNYLVHHSYKNKALYLFIAFMITLTLAFFSWKLVEEKMLKLKKRSALKKALVSI